MHEITNATIGFYAAVYAVAFFSCLARVIRKPGNVNWRNNLSLACTSGFLAFGCVCFLVDSSSSDGFNPWYWFGGSALLGLLAKEQDQIAKGAFSKVMFAGRKLFEKSEGDE